MKPICLLSYRLNRGNVDTTELARFASLFLEDRFGVTNLSSSETYRLTYCCSKAIAAARDNQLASGGGDFELEVSALYPRVALFWISDTFGLSLGELSRNTFGGRHASERFRGWLNAERNREFHIGKEVLEMAPVTY